MSETNVSTLVTPIALTVRPTMGDKFVHSLEAGLEVRNPTSAQVDNGSDAAHQRNSTVNPSGHGETASSPSRSVQTAFEVVRMLPITMPTEL
jgi:hypothetical protein